MAAVAGTPAWATPGAAPASHIIQPNACSYEDSYSPTSHWTDFAFVPNQAEYDVNNSSVDVDYT